VRATRADGTTLVLEAVRMNLDATKLAGMESSRSEGRRLAGNIALRG